MGLQSNGQVGRNMSNKKSSIAAVVKALDKACSSASADDSVRLIKLCAYARELRAIGFEPDNKGRVLACALRIEANVERGIQGPMSEDAIDDLILALYPSKLSGLPSASVWAEMARLQIGDRSYKSGQVTALRSRIEEITQGTEQHIVKSEKTSGCCGILATIRSLILQKRERGGIKMIGWLKKDSKSKKISVEEVNRLRIQRKLTAQQLRDVQKEMNSLVHAGIQADELDLQLNEERYEKLKLTEGNLQRQFDDLGMRIKKLNYYESLNEELEYQGKATDADISVDDIAGRKDMVDYLHEQQRLQANQFNDWQNEGTLAPEEKPRTESEYSLRVKKAAKNATASETHVEPGKTIEEV